ncbi:hypothetical protein KR009_003822 [Drosophila setifemur]|nr:hypothetical protein KR009_003822 [Drosophila setifemur]
MAYNSSRRSNINVGEHHQGLWSSTDISDEEENEFLLGYSNRTYGAPTVRFMGPGDVDPDTDGIVESEAGAKMETEIETEIKPIETIDMMTGYKCDASDNDIESILSFCNQLGEEDAIAANNFAIRNFSEEDQKHMAELKTKDTDLKTIIGKMEDNVATDTETVMNLNDDLQSVSSFGSYTPTVTKSAKYDDKMDNISGKTFFKLTTHREDIQNLSLNTVGEGDPGQVSSRTFDLSNRGTHSVHDTYSVSTCSWTDMYGVALQPSDSRSNIVPSLSLASVTSETSTFFKTLEENRERRGQAAYEEWKARKEEQKQQKRLAAKMELEKRKAESAVRQQLSQERFQEWCLHKDVKQQKQQKQLNKKSTITNTSNQQSTSNSGSGFVTPSGYSGKLEPEVARKRLKDWERVKTEQQQRERERIRKEEENKQKMECERKTRSQGAWKNWIKQADKRAKPVPLNQGFDTLRGTIANIYINPVQWVSNVEPQESGRSR